MSKKVISFCPICEHPMKATRLTCGSCGLEMLNDFTLNPFAYLNSVEYDFLICFLKNEGNLKAVEKSLNISYPVAKKRLGQLLISLNLRHKELPIVENAGFVRSSPHSKQASEIIKAKLIKAGGQAKASSITGKEYVFSIYKDGNSLYTENLWQHNYALWVFDVIVYLLRREGGRAKKGNGRNYKLGHPGCEFNTVVGAIGKYYFRKNEGDSVPDPVFILGTILQWAGICHNQRGYLTLTEEYKSLIGR